MDIKKQIINFNNPRTPLNAVGGVLHETANPNDNAQMEYQYFNSADRKASAHAFVDDKEIVQCIEWNNVAWHAGRTANMRLWGVEMCHTTDAEKFKRIWDSAVKLYAHLFTRVAYPPIYKVNPSNLMSHAEASAAWGETDHQDPVSYFAKFGKNMDNFRIDVQNQINNLLFQRAVFNNKLIRSPEYWVENCNGSREVTGSWMRQVMKNFVAMFKLCNNYAEVLEYLKFQGVIGSPEYWSEDKTAYNGSYARIVLINMGRYL